jgi:D-serine deaminase-like pyridoxal phosphate-dependent protein
MDTRYQFADAAALFSPALLFYADLIQNNLELSIRMACDPGRLRPHVKTHKTREIVRLCLKAGVTRHKCATIAEAELLASCGVPDVLVAYPLVGPNPARLAHLAGMFPTTHFGTTVDHPDSLAGLAQAFQSSPSTLDVLLDLDVGQHRTGLLPGPDAVALYEKLASTPHVRPGGLHVYDGHNHQGPPEERRTAALAGLETALTLRRTLESRGWSVPRLVVGGTPTFPAYAPLDIPGLECSPGTSLLYDVGYGNRFADLGFVPAALLLTRVISRPTRTRVTFDLGYKAVASDPPAGKRLTLLDIPSYEAVIHNEEHLTIESTAAERFQPGDLAFAIPTHVCPTVALHRQAVVIEGGRVTGRWDIVARDRQLTV